MSDAIAPPKYKVGDRVIWTNDYGVNWGVRTIKEVLEPDKWSNRYHIDPTDTPWMYVREKNLEPADGNYAGYGSY